MFIQIWYFLCYYAMELVVSMRIEMENRESNEHRYIPLSLKQACIE